MGRCRLTAGTATLLLHRPDERLAAVLLRVLSVGITRQATNVICKGHIIIIIIMLRLIVL